MAEVRSSKNVLVDVDVSATVVDAVVPQALLGPHAAVDVNECDSALVVLGGLMRMTVDVVASEL